MQSKYYTGAGHKPLNYVNREHFYLIMNCMSPIRFFNHENGLYHCHYRSWWRVM